VRAVGAVQARLLGAALRLCQPMVDETCSLHDFRENLKYETLMQGQVGREKGHTVCEPHTGTGRLFQGHFFTRGLGVLYCAASPPPALSCAPRLRAPA